MDKKTCEQCGKPCEKIRRFCSHKCYAKYLVKSPLIIRECLHCGKSFQIRQGMIGKGKHTGEYCSHSCSNSGKTGIQARHWKGGEWISNGYKYILSPDHPNVHKNGYFPEHRLVMEKHLGRYLESHEIVHHINENPTDNRIENLILCKNRPTHMWIHRRKKNKKIISHLDHP